MASKLSINNLGTLVYVLYARMLNSGEHYIFSTFRHVVMEWVESEQDKILQIELLEDYYFLNR
jgi:hypothetical protein